MADSRWSYALIQRANANIRKTDGCRDSFRIALGHYPHQCGVKSAADAREQAVLRRQSRRAASLPTSICRSKVTICSGLYLLMAITSSPPDGFSHSTWYKFRRSCHFLRHGEIYPCDEGTIMRPCPRSSPWMSLQLGIPGGLLSSRARFRFPSRSYTPNDPPRRTMHSQPTAKCSLTDCLSPGVQSNGCLLCQTKTTLPSPANE